MPALRLTSILTIIKRHQLKPDENNEYHITDAMVAEAQAIDEVQGVKAPPPEHFDSGWEEADPIESEEFAK